MTEPFEKVLITEEWHALPKDINGDEKKYKCEYPECGARFFRPGRLESHMRQHTGEKPFKCTQEGCEKAYTNNQHLKRHLQTHGAIKKVYECSKCQQQMSSLQCLKLHYERKHSGRTKLNSRMICEECGAQFSKIFSYQEHMAAHKNTSILYSCQECDVKFTSYIKYKKHRRSSHIKAFLCEFCPAIFDSAKLRNEHSKTVHSEAYTCQDCQRIFARKSFLDKHRSSACTQTLNFPCPFEDCTRFYRFKRNLKQHLLTNHLGRRYTCDVCGKEIMSKQKLENHIIKMHLSEPKTRRFPKGADRRRRKDAGIRRKSMVSRLVGLHFNNDLEKIILEREPCIKIEKS